MKVDRPDDTLVERLPAPASQAAVMSLSFLMVRTILSGRQVESVMNGGCRFFPIVPP